jgi:hypothetical protein
MIGFFFCFVSYSQAQTQEAEQLLLNWEKLTQFKKILQNMYDGYKVLQAGYNAVSDISQGSFSLHKAFLDGLMEVSPMVKKYHRITDIINRQVQIVKEYKSAFKTFTGDKNFTAEELRYIGKVYQNLFSESLQSIEELLTVITSGVLRMSDDERLSAIDRIHEKVEEQFTFLQEFNDDSALLAMQRASEQTEIEYSKKMSGY